jgi:hypothetical protein
MRHEEPGPPGVNGTLCSAGAGSKSCVFPARMSGLSSFELTAGCGRLDLVLGRLYDEMHLLWIGLVWFVVLSFNFCSEVREEVHTTAECA